MRIISKSFEVSARKVTQRIFLGVLPFTVSRWGQTTPQIAHNVSQIFVNLQ